MHTNFSHNKDFNVLTHAITAELRKASLRTKHLNTLAPRRGCKEKQNQSADYLLLQPKQV